MWTSPLLRGDGAKTGQGHRAVPAGTGTGQDWGMGWPGSPAEGTHSPGVREGMGQGTGMSQLCVVSGVADFLSEPCRHISCRPPYMHRCW